MSGVMHMATLVVEAFEIKGWPVTLKAPWLPFDHEIEVEEEFFKANFHRLDRQVFDFSLALSLMRMGVKVRRQGWMDMVNSIGIDEAGIMIECGERGASDMLKHELRTTDILAADWVVA